MSREIIYGCGITQDQREINNKIYQELQPLFKYASNHNYNDEDLNKYIVYSDLGFGYANHSYRVHSNPYNLSDDEIALVLDRGNLCFGYRRNGDVFTIYID